MKIWLGLKWAYQALLAGLHKLYDMILTGTFYLVAESERLWIGVNPETVSLDANNIQAAPLQVRFWAGEGSNKVAMPAYLTFRVESVVSSSVTKLFEDKPEVKVSSYDYTIPPDKYATANRISIYAHEDAARTKEIDAKQVNIVVANPTPFPRPEDWSANLAYKNGEYLLHDDVLYMWTSRVPGNTATDPKTWIQNNQDSGLWTPYPYSKVLAAQVLLANFALVGSAVFKDQYMFSQQGLDSLGVETNDYRNFGTHDFTPNLILDFLTGSSIFNKTTVRGTIEAISGLIGGLTIKGNSLVSDSMEFSESPIEALSLLKVGQSTSISRQASWTSEIVGNAYTQAFTINLASSVSFKVTTTSTSTIEKGWTVSIIKEGGGVVYYTFGMGEITNKEFTVVLPPGTYTINAKSTGMFYIDEPIYNYAWIGGISSANTITAVGYPYRTKIGNNGFYSFWDANKYLYFSSSVGLELVFGNYGMRVGSSGLQKTSNAGSSWANL